MNSFVSDWDTEREVVFRFRSWLVNYFGAVTAIKYTLKRGSKHDFKSDAHFPSQSQYFFLIDQVDISWVI